MKKKLDAMTLPISIPTKKSTQAAHISKGRNHFFSPKEEEKAKKFKAIRSLLLSLTQGDDEHYESPGVNPSC